MTELAVAATPVRGRLDRALVDYLGTIGEQELDDVNIEAVAIAAGVSRATAYRHFGDRDGLIVRGAVELIRRHAAILGERQARLPTLAAKIEESFAYMAAAIEVDKVLALLLASDREDDVNRAWRDMSLEIVSEACAAGQLDGQLRDDLTIDEVIDWLSQQRRVAIRLGLDEPGVRLWVRRFVIPALRPQGVPNVSRAEVQAVLTDLTDRLNALGSVVSRTATSLR